VANNIAAMLRRGALTVAAGRAGLGVTALIWPRVPARPWVGSAAADGVAARVFGRALGARDLALGLGAMAALGRADATGSATASGDAGGRAGAADRSAAAWVAAGALSDALDVAASVSSWHELPRVSRWLVVLSAGGAAVVGAAGAAAALAAPVVPAAPAGKDDEAVQR
jgi:hypothetical protein